MKTVLSFLALMPLALPAQALSLHPCTPSVKAQPTLISCQQGSNSVSIRIETMMSDVRRGCTGANYFERHTAFVSVNSGKETIIPHQDFSYTLSPDGDATFSSPSRGLILRHCVTPLNGGVSFAN